MRVVKEAPGVFSVEMTDEERRAAYRIDPEMVAAMRAAKRTGDVSKVRKLLERSHDPSEETDADASQGRHGETS